LEITRRKTAPAAELTTMSATGQMVNAENHGQRSSARGSSNRE
jgi:hypothetical protein